MYAGFLFKKVGLLEKINISQVLILMVIGLIAIIRNPIDTVSFDNNRYGNPILMLIGAIPTVISLAYITRILFEQENNIGKLLAFMGRHTIFFMGFDYFFNTVCSYVLSKIGINYCFFCFPFEMLNVMYRSISVGTLLL